MVTIVVPMFNEEHSLRQTLASILAQDYPRDSLEVLLVDGGSTDASLAIARDAVAQHAHVKLLANPARVVPAALNLGIAQSKGEVIVRLDAHSLYPPDYVSRCVAALYGSGADNVGGPITTAAGGDGVFALAIAVALSTRFGVGNSAFRTRGRSGDVDTVPYGAFRRDVFERVGGFDERLARNQDIEFNARIRRAGGRVVLDESIESTYVARPSLRWLIQQNFRNGCWVSYTASLGAGSLSWRHFAPLVFVAAVLAGGAVAALVAPLRAAWVLLLASYGLACLIASLVQLRVAGPRVAALLAPTYCLLHSSYGAGSAWGWLSLPWFRRETAATHAPRSTGPQHPAATAWRPESWKSG